jgi:hypothetical protein
MDPTTASTHLVQGAHVEQPKVQWSARRRELSLHIIMIGIIVLVIIVAALAAHFGYFSRTRPQTETEKALLILKNLGNGTLKFDEDTTCSNVDFNMVQRNTAMKARSNTHEKYLRQLDEILNDTENREKYKTDGTLALAKPCANNIIRFTILLEEKLNKINAKLEEGGCNVTAAQLNDVEQYGEDMAYLETHMEKIGRANLAALA